MRMEHANVTVDSIDCAVKFLGAAFPQWSTRGAGYMHGDIDLGDWVHFGNDDTYLALQQNRVHEPRRDNTYRHDGINHLGFVVEGLDELIARLDKAGYQPSDASDIDTHPFRSRVYFKDGNGFEWEFIEYRSDKAAERNDYSR